MASQYQAAGSDNIAEHHLQMRGDKQGGKPDRQKEDLPTRPLPEIIGITVGI